MVKAFSRWSVLALCLALVGAQTVHAQLGCRTFRKMASVADPLLVADAIAIPLDFRVGTVAVDSIKLAHPRIGALRVSLVHGDPETRVVLKQARQGTTGANLEGTSFADSAPAGFPAEPSAAPFTGTFQPAQPLSAFAQVSSMGPWTLEVADLADNSEGRVTTLSGWALTLCPSLDPNAPAPAVASADGGADTPAATPTDAPAMDMANMTCMGANGSEEGVLGLVQDLVTLISPLNGEVFIRFTTDGTNATNAMPVTASNGLRSNATTRASGAAGGLLGLTLAAKDAGRDHVKTQITDLASLASAQAAAVKEYVNKKLSDYIRSVQATSALTQQVLKGGRANMAAGALSLHKDAVSLKGLLAEAGDAVRGDLAKQASDLADLTQVFSNTAGGLVGGMASTAGLVKDLVVAKAQAVGDVYTTAEGAVKALVDNVVLTKVTAFNSLLDRHIRLLEGAQGLTGPALDKALGVHLAALATTQKAATAAAAAVAALPTPSQVVTGKIQAVQRIANAVLSNTRVGQALTALASGSDLQSALSQMVTKGRHFNRLYSQVLGGGAAAGSGFEMFRAGNTTAAAAPSNGTLSIAVAVGGARPKTGARKLL